MRLLILILLFISCEKESNYHQAENPVNLDPNKPYVLLISLDGYRFDYTDKYKPKFLSWLSQSGARLKSLSPSFPTKTYPNHLSLVTGMYPTNHGIVANTFYDSKLKRVYKLRDREAVKDPTFYKGKPIWVLAEEQGIVTADYYWPGAEAPILGKHPSYYFTYDHGAKHDGRVAQIKKWLELPEKVRPHLITLYFHDVDTAGHKFGPNSSQVSDAIKKVDESISKIYASLKELQLNLNIIVVSDHGMVDMTSFKKVSIRNENTNSLVDQFNTYGKGPIISLFAKSKKNEIDAAVQRFNSNAKGYTCYPGVNTPEEFNYNDVTRVGDIVCIAKTGFSIYNKLPYLSIGGHGWSQNEGMDMHGILYAKGPGFKNNFVMDTKANIHLYPLVAKLLGLNITHRIDGKIEELSPLLK